MARQYYYTDNEISPSLATDLFNLGINTGNPCVKIKRIMITEADSTLATATDMRIVVKRYYGTSVTQDTSGHSGGIAQLDRGDYGTRAKAHSQTSTGTTATSNVTILDYSVYLYQGFDYIFDEPIVITGSDVVVVTISSDTPLSGVTNLSLTVWWEEEGI